MGHFETKKVQNILMSFDWLEAKSYDNFCTDIDDFHNAVIFQF